MFLDGERTTMELHVADEVAHVDLGLTAETPQGHAQALAFLRAEAADTQADLHRAAELRTG
jgi:hypothetical protein